MARKQVPILDARDSSNYWFVIQWVSRRFDEEDRDPGKFVMSLPSSNALDDPGPINLVHAEVRASWRVLQKQWLDGWDNQFADAYFDDLVVRTNVWLEHHFPANDLGPGRERKRLLAAVRQQKLREKRKGYSRDQAIQVTIAGKLHQQVVRTWLAENQRHDFVRAALEIVLESPELTSKAKAMMKTRKDAKNVKL